MTNDYRDLYLKLSDKSAPMHVLIQWKYWIKGFSGLTIGPIIFVKSKKDMPLVIHELVHVSQFYKQPLTFFVRYFFELAKNGYRKNKYEIEAYKIQKTAKKYLDENNEKR